jgi:hypothetical protein
MIADPPRVGVAVKMGALLKGKTLVKQVRFDVGIGF